MFKRFVAVLLIALVTPLLTPAFAQDALGLTASQLKTVDALGDESLKHSSTYIQGLRDLDAAQREESPLGVAGSSLNLTVGGGIGATDPFEQVNSRASLTVSVNLTDLLKTIIVRSSAAHSVDVLRNHRVIVGRVLKPVEIDRAKIA